MGCARHWVKSVNHILPHSHKWSELRKLAADLNVITERNDEKGDVVDRIMELYRWVDRNSSFIPVLIHFKPCVLPRTTPAGRPSTRSLATKWCRRRKEKLAWYVACRDQNTLSWGKPLPAGTQLREATPDKYKNFVLQDSHLWSTECLSFGGEFSPNLPTVLFVCAIELGHGN